MFTIKVKKRGKDEKFSFKDLLASVNVVHDDCFGGETEFRLCSTDDADYWSFYCLRCEARTRIDKVDEQDMKTNFVQTAIDGEERKICEGIRVIQKT